MANAGCCGCNKRKGTIIVYKVKNGQKLTKGKRKVCEICAQQMVATGDWSY